MRAVTTLSSATQTDKADLKARGFADHYHKKYAHIARKLYRQECLQPRLKSHHVGLFCPCRQEHQTRALHLAKLLKKLVKKAIVYHNERRYHTSIQNQTPLAFTKKASKAN